MLQSDTPSSAPVIPDYELVRLIGRGGYGDVWLARSVTGTYRAVKIIYQSRFKEARPFDREFTGVKCFEPISREHRGLVAILHVGRNQAAGHFHYVMEVADDAINGSRIDPATYVPKTLSHVLEAKRRFPIAEAANLALALTSAVGFMHTRRLVHRDIKPSNIIFVNDQPKFADIGLVTGMGENSSPVGTLGYIPREGPGSAAADLYSLGKVLYQVVMGQTEQDFPDLPARLGETTSVPDLLRFNDIILKATEDDRTRRYQSAEEMEIALRELLENHHTTRGTVDHKPELPSTAASARSNTTRLLKGLKVAVLYKARAAEDCRLVEYVQKELANAGCEILDDKNVKIGVDWVRQIETKIRRSDAVIVLLSDTSVQSEMVAYEVEIARQSAQHHNGKPRLLPVRVQFPGRLPPVFASLLDPLYQFVWQGRYDNERIVTELIRALEISPPTPAVEARPKLESIGGAVPLDSRFYVVREADQEFQNALNMRDSIVLVKGARQMGKTSVLARGLKQARDSGARVVLTDFQKLNASHLESLETFYVTLCDFLADQLGLSVMLKDTWDGRRSPNTNFERYLRHHVFEHLPGHLVWGLDEVDRLFTCKFGSEVFGLFRSWHNERSLDPDCPWSRLTLAIAYATEAHLFITDINQSPFNVGTRLTLEDFNLAQVIDLNQRYAAPLESDGQVQEFFELVGGQPYLVRRGLNDLAAGTLRFDEFKAHADKDEGIFGDHLRRILVLLAKDAELSQVVRGILGGHTPPNAASFYRLRSAGLMRGDSPQDVRPRCQIYASYLKRHLP